METQTYRNLPEFKKFQEFQLSLQLEKRNKLVMPFFVCLVSINGDEPEVLCVRANDGYLSIDDEDPVLLKNRIKDLTEDNRSVFIESSCNRLFQKIHITFESPEMKKLFLRALGNLFDESSTELERSEDSATGGGA